MVILIFNPWVHGLWQCAKKTMLASANFLNMRTRRITIVHSPVCLPANPCEARTTGLTHAVIAPDVLDVLLPAKLLKLCVCVCVCVCVCMYVSYVCIHIYYVLIQSTHYLNMAKGDNWPYSERGVPWTKGGGHCSTQCVHPGASTGSQCAWEGGQAHETPHS